MNHHEWASACAHGEVDPAVARALDDYTRAMRLFSDFGDEDTAIDLIRGAHATLVERLGPQHPECIQVKNTLAGRLRGKADTIGERTQLRLQLVELADTVFGPESAYALNCAERLGQVLWSAGRLDEAMVAYERAFDGFVSGPKPSRATTVISALAKVCREVGTPERTVQREERLCASLGRTDLSVRYARLWRTAALRRRFNREAVLHAAQHLPRMHELLSSVYSDPVAGRDMLRKVRETANLGPGEAHLIDAVLHQLAGEADELAEPDALPDRAAYQALQALETLEEARGDILEDPSDPYDEPEYPLADAEAEWQAGHFDALWAEYVGKGGL